MKILYLATLMGLACVVLLASIIFTDMTLFWTSISAIFVLVYIALLKRVRASLKLLILVAFILIIRSSYLTRDFLYDGSLLLPADTSYSLQLVRLIVESGRIEAGMGTHRAISYSYFPLPFIFSSVFILITGVSDTFFASVYYPMLTSLLAVILLYVLYRRIFSSVERNHAIGMAIFSTFIFTLSVRFFSLHRAFRHENISFLYLILALIFVTFQLTSPQKFKRKHSVLAIISAGLIPLSHQTTGDIALLFMFSAVLFVRFTYFRRSLRPSSHKNDKSVTTLNRLLNLFTLLLIVIISVSVYVTWQEYSLNLKHIVRRIFSSLMGEAAIGLSKFSPFNYSKIEIYMIIAGSIALGILLLFSFIRFLKEKNGAVNRFFQYEIVIFALLGIYLIYLSPFGITVFERGYFYLLLFSSICAAWFIVKAKTKAKVIALVIMLLFFTSQITLDQDHLKIASTPLVLKSNVVVASEAFRDFGAFSKGRVTSMPPSYFEIFTAINRLNPTFGSGDVMMKFLAFDTESVIQDSDYILIYDTNWEMEKRYVEPELREILKVKISLIRDRLNLIYNQGCIYVFRVE